MKTLFTFNVDNIIDLITNSSSELFILNGETTEAVEEMVREVYPNYDREYEPVVSLKEASTDAIGTYFAWVEQPWHHDDDSWRLSDDERRAKRIEKCEKTAARFNMLPEELYSNWATRNKDKWYFPHESDEGLRKIAEQLDPNGKIFLLLSKDENPNYEYQEKLENIGTRYHLG